MKNKNSISLTDEKYHFGKGLSALIFKPFYPTVLLLFFLSIYEYSFQFLKGFLVTSIIHSQIVLS